MCQRILSALLPLLAQSDTQVQTWAFVTVASIAHLDLPAAAGDVERPRDRKSKSNSQWDQVWTLVLRKVNSPSVSRVATHAANILLAHDRVSPAPLAHAIETLAKDLDAQGPSFPSDAVCTFLEWCIALASTDVRLYRLHIPEKVLSWLTNAWRPLDGIHRPLSWAHARPRSDPLSSSHLVSLITRVCSMDQAPQLPYDYVVPDCAVATMAIDQCETTALREFIDAKIPPYSRKQAAASKMRTPQSVSLSATTGTVEDPEHKTERRISVWLQRLLEKLLSDGVEGGVVGLDYWTLMNVETARRHLDLATVALVVEGLFAYNKGREGKATNKAAAEILCKLAPTIGMSKW